MLTYRHVHHLYLLHSVRLPLYEPWLVYTHCNKLVTMHSIHVGQAQLALANIVHSRNVGMSVLNCARNLRSTRLS